MEEKTVFEEIGEFIAEENKKVYQIQFDDLPKTRVPIFDFCRQLIKEGKDPDTRLEVFRKNQEPDVIVTKIGWGAKYTVREDARVAPTLVKFKSLSVDTYSVQNEK